MCCGRPDQLVHSDRSVMRRTVMNKLADALEGGAATEASCEIMITDTCTTRAPLCHVD